MYKLGLATYHSDEVKWHGPWKTREFTTKHVNVIKSTHQRVLHIVTFNLNPISLLWQGLLIWCLQS